ncbi:MAG: hypothetical protein NZM04_03955 [Methylacidiphilales bacterium]|nr:hypothetical protein [Candidatus Methylacidiphilales bacterium]
MLFKPFFISKRPIKITLSIQKILEKFYAAKQSYSEKKFIDLIDHVENYLKDKDAQLDDAKNILLLKIAILSCAYCHCISGDDFFAKMAIDYIDKISQLPLSIYDRERYNLLRGKLNAATHKNSYELDYEIKNILSNIETGEQILTYDLIRV